MSTIRVTGRGSIHVVPDVTRIEITVSGVFKAYDEAYKKAQEAYKDAMQKFNWADEDVFEIANEELSLAQMKLNVSAKKVKMLMAENKE